MCVCVCVVCVFARVALCMCMCLGGWVCVCACVCVCGCMCMYMCMCVCVEYVCVCACGSVYVCIVCTYLCVNACACPPRKYQTGDMCTYVSIKFLGLQVPTLSPMMYSQSSCETLVPPQRGFTYTDSEYPCVVCRCLVRLGRHIYNLPHVLHYCLCMCMYSQCVVQEHRAQNNSL